MPRTGPTGTRQTAARAEPFRRPLPSSTRDKIPRRQTSARTATATTAMRYGAAARPTASATESAVASATARPTSDGQLRERAVR